MHLPRRVGSTITERPTRRAALAEVKDETEDDWFGYRVEHHPEFLRRMAEARADFRSGGGVRLEDLPW